MRIKIIKRNQQQQQQPTDQFDEQKAKAIVQQWIYEMRTAKLKEIERLSAHNPHLVKRISN